MVTHNANLPVVNTDADQIILAEVGTSNGQSLPPITYRSGSLDQRETRRFVRQVLEGGEQAFLDRARRLRIALSSITSAECTRTGAALEIGVLTMTAAGAFLMLAAPKSQVSAPASLSPLCGREVLFEVALLGRVEHALDVVEDAVEHVAGGVAAAEVERPAGAGALAADAEAAGAGVEGAARAAGAGRGGVRAGALGLGEDREQGAPFGFGVVGGVLQGGAEQVAVAAGDQRGEAEELAEREGLGGGEIAFEVVGEVGDGAQAGGLSRLRFA